MRAEQISFRNHLLLCSPPSLHLVVVLQLLVHIVIVSKVSRPPRQNVRKDMGQKVTVALSSTIALWAWMVVFSKSVVLTLRR